MQKEIYSPDFLIVFQGCIMKFGTIQGWIEMDEVDYADIRPANYEECVAYSNVNK